MRFCILE